MEAKYNISFQNKMQVKNFHFFILECFLTNVRLFITSLIVYFLSTSLIL